MRAKPPPMLSMPVRGASTPSSRLGSAVSARDIEQAALWYGRAGKAGIYYTLGITEHTHGTDNVYCLANLVLMTGHLGKPSAGMNPLRGQNNVQGCGDAGCLPNSFPGYQVISEGTVKKFQEAWGNHPLPPEKGMVVTDMVGAAKYLEDLGCDYVIHHIGYDQRRGIAAAGRATPSPLDQLQQVVDAVNVPVQAVGGLSIEQAIQTPKFGAPLVVIGAPLTIDADAFKTATGDVEDSLRLICQAVHGFGDV
mgnify:CR=1 FL=1